ncbi:MAG TPA: sulfotransferase [candidate division Zixibacteria bacterium]|nr:sulfotransferase [candidate division Zixibacteria bacterium]
MTIHEPDPAPVFLTGLDRTGKTVLRRALVARSSLWLSRHTALWSVHHGRYGDLRSDAALDRCLRALLARPPLARQITDAAALADALRSGPRTYGRLFGLILAAAANREGKRRWGEQDADLEALAGRLFADYPEATVVHLLRDPRTRYAALVRDEGRRPGGVRVASAAWLRSVRRAQHWAAHFPGRYLLVRVEDFGDPPGPSVVAMVERLGAEFIDGTRLSGVSDETLPSLRPWEVGCIEEHVGEVMVRHGYRVSGGRLGGADRARCRLLEAPIGGLRLAVRRIRARPAPRGER